MTAPLPLHIFTPGRTPIVVFLPGYASDMGGTKAVMLEEWAQATGQAFIRLDYRGISPLIAGDIFRVKAKRQADGSVRGWTEGVDGRVRMEGVHRPA